MFVRFLKDMVPDLPPRWQIRPFWSVFRRIKQTGFSDDQLLSVYRDHGVIPRESRDDNFNRAPQDLSNYQLVKPGHLVTNKMKAWQGSIAISRYRGIVSPAYYVYEPVAEHYPQYIHYLLRSAPYVAMYRRISKGIRVAQWDLEHEALRRIPLLFPPIDVQQRIADFLDRETARIDELVEKKERLLGLLGTQSRAIVDSAFEGLRAGGIAPRRVAYFVTKVGSGKTPRGGSSVYLETGVRFIRSQNVHNDGLRLHDVAFIPHDVDAEMSGTRVKENDVLLNITGASIGRVAVVGKEALPANVNQHVCILRPTAKVDPHFLQLAIMSSEVQDQIKLESFSANREGLNFEEIKNLLVLVPEDVRVQREVVARTKTKMLRLRTLRRKLELSVEALRELRAALITEAVTGQIAPATL